MKMNCGSKHRIEMKKEALRLERLKDKKEQNPDKIKRLEESIKRNKKIDSYRKAKFKRRKERMEKKHNAKM